MATDDLLGGFARRKVYSVSDLNAMVRLILEEGFAGLTVEGEIGNFTRSGPGHLYFTLKDDKSQVRCVMWRSRAMFLRFKPELGMQVTVRGDLSVYEPRGEYQISVSSIEPAGIGALQMAFEQLKKKLEAEGLFDSARKKPIPFLPQRLGIVTSPSGAAIRDVLTVLDRRYPNIQVTIYPTLVQGADAPAQIAEGIRALDAMGFDVLIVTRGGGSLEDLMAFNDEAVARAIAACRTPVISAVGHEVDFTIADFVADLRAPTPSAAAEIVVGRKDDLKHTLLTHERRLVNALRGRMNQVQTLLRAASPERLLVSVRRGAQSSAQRLDGDSARLEFAARSLAGGRRRVFGELAAGLEALSPLKILARGYGIVTRSDEREPLSTVAGLTAGDRVDVRLADGTLGCAVETIDKGVAK